MFKYLVFFFIRCFYLLIAVTSSNFIDPPFRSCFLKRNKEQLLFTFSHSLATCNLVQSPNCTTFTRFGTESKQFRLKSEQELRVPSALFLVSSNLNAQDPKCHAILWLPENNPKNLEYAHYRQQKLVNSKNFCSINQIQLNSLSSFPLLAEYAID